MCVLSVLFDMIVFLVVTGFRHVCAASAMALIHVLISTPSKGSLVKFARLA